MDKDKKKEGKNNQTDTEDVDRNEARSTKATILIVLFGIALSLVVSSELSLVVQKILDIPPESIGLARWGDAFFLRIIASLAAMTAGAFVIGTFLRKKRVQIAGVVAAVPGTLFWVVALILGIMTGSDYGFTFDSAKQMVVLPSILTVLLPTVGYYGAGWGHEVCDNFQRPKSILNIKWYHWLWILPFYVSKVVPVLAFLVISLIRFDFGAGSAVMYPSIFTFIANWGYYLGRVILIFVIYALLLSVNHAYSLLVDESKTTKEKWKKAVMLLGHVLLFFVLYSLFFGQYL